MGIHCGIVPNYLLDRLVENGDPRTARIARNTLQARAEFSRRREVRAARRGPDDGGIVPADLVRRSKPGSTQAGPTLRSSPGGVAETHQVTAAAVPDRSVHDAEHGTTLPGRLVRAEGGPESTDESVNEAYDGLGETFDLFAQVYGRDSLDGKGLTLVATVHYDREFDNAFWDGTQMVFGDGDGRIFNSFTDSVDVIAHELAHGFTQFTAGLTYVGQSGALNESVSDVFGALVKQRVLDQVAGEADWLIGSDLFTDRVNGVALRSMKAPGTAYDDPVLGKDPQPATMADYVTLPHDEQNDNGGVHINSGIPNHAFYLAATAIGGAAWEKAGRVWYAVMTDGGLPKDADFVTFAEATVSCAERLFDDGSVAPHVQQAWEDVGIL